MQDKKEATFGPIFSIIHSEEKIWAFFQHFKLSSDSYNEVPEAQYNK